MGTITAISTFLTIAGATILGPLIIYKLYLPWVKKRAKWSLLFSAVIVFVNFLVYGYWLFFVVSSDSQHTKTLLMSMPLLIALVIEALSILMNKARWLNEISKISAVMGIPFVMLNLHSDSILYLGMTFLIIQSVLYFPTFGLLKNKDKGVPFAFEVKVPFENESEFHKSTDYKTLKETGIKNMSLADLLLVFLKYGAVFLGLYAYSHIVAGF